MEKENVGLALLLIATVGLAYIAYVFFSAIGDKINQQNERLTELIIYFKEQGYKVDNSRLSYKGGIYIYAETLEEFEDFLDETQATRLYTLEASWRMTKARIMFPNEGILYVYDIFEEVM